MRKGDVIVPRKRRGKRDWKTWALEIEKIRPDGSISAFPLDGGISYRFSRADAKKFDFVVIDPGEEPSFWTSGMFSVDELGQFKGWWDGTRWNGWATPVFELKEARRIARAVQALHTAGEVDDELVYDKRAEAFIEKSQGEELVISPERINVRGRIITVYPIGGGSWTWKDEDEDEDDDDGGNGDGPDAGPPFLYRTEFQVGGKR